MGKQYFVNISFKNKIDKLKFIGSGWENFVRKSLPTFYAKSTKCNWIAGNINISEDYNMEKSIFEQMGGTYHKQGDYFLPDLAVPRSAKTSTGVWDQRHLRYIRGALQRALCQFSVKRQAGQLPGRY